MTVSYYTGKPHDEDRVLHTGFYTKTALDVLRAVHACEFDQTSQTAQYMPDNEMTTRSVRVYNASFLGMPPAADTWMCVSEVFRAGDGEVCLYISPELNVDLGSIRKSWAAATVKSLKRLRRWLGRIDKANERVSFRVQDFFRFAPGYREKNYYNAPKFPGDKLKYVSAEVCKTDVKMMYDWMECRKAAAAYVVGQPANPVEAKAVDNVRAEVAAKCVELREAFDKFKKDSELAVEKFELSCREAHEFTRFDGKREVNYRWVSPANNDKIVKLRNDTANAIGVKLNEGYELIKRMLREKGLED